MPTLQRCIESVKNLDFPGIRAYFGMTGLLRVRNTRGDLARTRGLSRVGDRDRCDPEVFRFRGEGLPDCVQTIAGRTARRSGERLGGMSLSCGLMHQVLKSDFSFPGQTI